MKRPVALPYREIEFSFARSSGPGGQNVNKVNSKVILRWSPVNSSMLNNGMLARFLARFGNRLTSDGVLILASDRHRDQMRNKAECIQKLANMLAEVAEPPKPRKKTRPSRASTEKRKSKKRLHSDKKRHRRRVGHEE